MSQPIEIWAVADSRRGVENQALGLAESLAGYCGGQVHRVLARNDGYAALPNSENPDIWIGCGRPSIAIARQHRSVYRGCKFVYVQDPRSYYQLFDTIVAPDHDRLRRAKAVSMIGSPNRLSAEKLTAAQMSFENDLAKFPEPRIAMLIGGPNKRLQANAGVINSLVDRAKTFLDQGHSLLITTSRRTPAGLVRRLAELRERPNCWVYTGEGENPYFAFLAAADWIFVTEDSTNMLTEAAFTGKPVYSLPLEGNPGKFRRLYAALESYGALRPFLGRLETWTYVPLNETGRIAGILADRFNLKR
ncbi:mitochondrial fission ELM1 family protein [Hyphobacterium sp.]|uniref:mitochondrial fission ELM1 family protein n=1 Tax=Hyphobacterium sp. TaxID=2004662 RepID=UPI003BAC2B9D